MSDDAKKAKWWDTRRKVWSGFTGIPNRQLDGAAYAALTSAAAVRSLSWFWQEARYEQVKKRPGADSPIGRIDKIINNGKISFTYQIAAWRGMNHKRFSRVLKELHRLGFIDVAHLGRGVRGDYTKFSLSNRWMKYGTSDWQEIVFPENFREGWREINNGRQRPLLTDTNVRYEVVKLPDNGRERPLKTTPDANFQRTRTSVSKDSCHAVRTAFGGDGLDGKVEEEGLESNRAPEFNNSGEFSPSKKNGKPTKAEITEKVRKVLDQLPNHNKAANRHFQKSIVSQLEDVRRGLLDCAKVRRGLEKNAGIPDSVLNDLFAGTGEAN